MGARSSSSASRPACASHRRHRCRRSCWRPSRPCGRRRSPRTPSRSARAARCSPSCRRSRSSVSPTPCSRTARVPSTRSFCSPPRSRWCSRTGCGASGSGDRSGRDRGRAASVTSVRGSRPVALTVIAAAVLVPGLLPGFRSGPLVDLSTAGDEGAGLDPFISIHAQLDEQGGPRPVRGPDAPTLSTGGCTRSTSSTARSGGAATRTGPVAARPSTVPTVLPQPPGYAPPPDTADAAVHVPDPERRLRRHARAPDGADAGGDLGRRPRRRDVGPGPGPGVRGRRARRGARVRGHAPASSCRRPRSSTRSVTSPPCSTDDWTDLPGDDVLDPQIGADRERLDGRRDDSDYDKVLAIQQHFHSERVPLHHRRRRRRRRRRTARRSSRRPRPASASSTPRRWPCWSASSASRPASRWATRPARCRTTATYLVQTQGRTRVGRGLLRGVRVAPVRAHAGTRHPPERRGRDLPEPRRARPRPGRGRSDEQGNAHRPRAAARRVRERVLARPRERQLLCNTEQRPERRSPGEGSSPRRRSITGQVARRDRLLGPVPADLPRSARGARHPPDRGPDREVRVAPPAPAPFARAPRTTCSRRIGSSTARRPISGLGRREGETLEEHRARLAAAIAFTDGHLGRLTSLARHAPRTRPRPPRATKPTPPSTTPARRSASCARTPASSGGSSGPTGRVSRYAFTGPSARVAAASRRARTNRSRSSRNCPTLLSTPVAISSIATKNASCPSRRASMISPLRRAILKMLTPSVIELDLGQVPVQRGPAVEVVPRAADALERHPVVEQGLHDLQRDQVTERVQPRNPGAAAGPLHGRVDEPDLVPVPELTRGASGELRRLMCGESLHRNERPPTTSPSRHQRVPPARRGEVSTSVRRSRPRGR